MSATILEQVLELVKQLTTEERLIVERKLLEEMEEIELTREMLLEEHEQLKAEGAFEHVVSLGNAFANPQVSVSDEELNAYLRQIGKEWESELDEL
jgi:hypothetical protein